MTTAMTEQRPLYGIGTVARLAGIKPDTLRIWERRYGLGASQKGDNGRRLYSQTDLEHLQIVARLVTKGFRIGEIASMERKTLAALLEQEGGGSQLPSPRPKGLFLGTALCDWLDHHPGCLSGLDSSLVRAQLSEAIADAATDLGQPQLLVVEAAAMGTEQMQLLLKLHQRLGEIPALLLYEFASPRNLETLAQAGFRTAQLPLETSMFAESIRPLVNAVEVDRGTSDAGELAVPQPRLFRDKDLLDILKQPSALECGCSHHLSEVIQSLVNFEEYSSQCSVESWRDAATHTCVYAYTNQARWLMEKALVAVLEEHKHHEE